MISRSLNDVPKTLSRFPHPIVIITIYHHSSVLWIVRILTALAEISKKTDKMANVIQQNLIMHYCLQQINITLIKYDIFLFQIVFATATAILATQSFNSTLLFLVHFRTSLIEIYYIEIWRYGCSRGWAVAARVDAANARADFMRC